MAERLRSWIVEVLEHHRPLLAVAVRQRAKFEGWLKFELAVYAEEHGATGVEVETASDLGSRSDLSFNYDGKRYDIELKTCNTNYRMSGVLDCTRPITKNIASVVIDGKKLRQCSGDGIVAFCLFPVKAGDGQWIDYLNRIGSELGVSLSEREHTSRVTVPVRDGHRADIVVATFIVKGAGAAVASATVVGP
ncbi:MAG: hypothetical protein A3G76_00700 [Acidobacteria bacterium RIFCSPLOWO2_12_FULL_65_11]|nr:MAG: hypothetical protein A3H95_07590 [Acidobacteria bacterium RIFCSPLOWO2_02_FULL_64_15]OFW34613.1 MAG: hypothetical protein A3G76_00700 [Acidobacteria bacterium RIFCSPLOWO2_12_FULL_65_11]